MRRPQLDVTHSQRRRARKRAVEVAGKSPFRSAPQRFEVDAPERTTPLVFSGTKGQECALRVIGEPVVGPEAHLVRQDLRLCGGIVPGELANTLPGVRSRRLGRASSRGPRRYAAARSAGERG